MTYKQANDAHAAAMARIRKKRPERRPIVVLYATEGFGKTTAAAEAGAAIVPAEDGAAEIDAEAHGAIVFQPAADWEEFRANLALLRSGEVESKPWVAVDTWDALEKLAHAHVCTEAGVESISDFDHGRGYVEARELLRLVMSDLELIREETGAGILILAHADPKPFRNPVGEDFDRYACPMNDKAWGDLKAWADVVLFGEFEQYAVKKGSKTIGVSTGARVLHSQRTAAFDAKTRIPLPDRLPFSWAELQKAMTAREAGDPAKLRAAISGLLGQVDEKVAERVKVAVAKVGDSSVELKRILDKLGGMVSETEGTEEEGS